MKRIGQLYGIEKEIRGRSPAERREVRQARSRPLLDSLLAWLKATASRMSSKSDVTAAIQYALGRWDALTLYCEDGRVEMDNNAAERALRAVALGRKNYLFAGSDAGGERAAAIRTDFPSRPRPTRYGCSIVASMTLDAFHAPFETVSVHFLASDIGS